ncbi:hypothetical protein CQW23_09855 [Capsicum baccatum]|uniref:Uncharacterized protein n=1 Tax=Capsicum baccatum TaxID=33114 RepID=A0A2G2WXZ7_CAPBA|nr:hypothetical protein CQW23_09855 [Capsicum baccatum]
MLFYLDQEAGLRIRGLLILSFHNLQVLLRGSCLEGLKKLKRVAQYAVFAIYHLSLETSFLLDEGSSLPKVSAATSIAILERTFADNSISVISHSSVPERSQTVANDPYFQGVVSLSDQMDLLVDQVKMLAGEITLSMSTLKRMIEQPVNDPEN